VENTRLVSCSWHPATVIILRIYLWLIHLILEICPLCTLYSVQRTRVLCLEISCGDAFTVKHILYFTLKLDYRLHKSQKLYSRGTVSFFSKLDGVIVSQVTTLTTTCYLWIKKHTFYINNAKARFISYRWKIIYRGPGLLAVLWFGSSPAPPPSLVNKLTLSKGAGEEQNHTTAREPGPLLIIQYSLSISVILWSLIIIFSLTTLKIKPQ
jgi:hypothetical protein